MTGTAERPAAAAAGSTARRRVRLRIEGTVQGVGFRPFVHRLAGELGVSGFVLNDERGVVVEAEGTEARLEELVRRVRVEAPPLAAIERIDVEPGAVTGETGFAIVASDARGDANALISPDTATCEDCLREVFDPADRRHRYPFTNCTNCGPRFTIVRAVPYDRRATTMASFEMCMECRAEYEDPGNRRFHAQPNACPACGPQARTTDRAGRVVTPGPGHDAVSIAAQALGDGRIVALKGIGGFHLACRADAEDAVAELRARKHREDKPFALMASDLAVARRLVALTEAEERLLLGPERPIVIARRRQRAAVADSVAPGSPDLGVMLPYSPLHHLLLADVGQPLVMTSGNVSDEPIAFRDEDALRRLADVGDLFLLHDRPIHMRTDDSVLRATGRSEPLVIRRSRGFVPRSIDLPIAAPRHVLACGAELKSTFCLAKGRRAWVGHHIGDLKNYETLISFREGIEHFKGLFAVSPQVVAHDLHPDYLSSAYASELEGVELVGVQHHHAHLAACLAEHGETEPAVGAIFDGTGYGSDGSPWGGEVLAGELTGFERAGMILPVPLPGADRAVREPWRMACAWTRAALEREHPQARGRLAGAVGAREWQAVCELAGSGLVTTTSSAGRLFDAVAALCGIRPTVNYEGQAAAELEAVADRDESGAYPMPVGDGERLVIDPRETVRCVIADLERGVAVGTVSARFHNALAAAAARAVALAAERRSLTSAVLSGGVFQNRLLLDRTAEAIAAAGLRLLVPRRLPPNDGGIAYGQAAVAAARTVTT